MGTLKTVVLVLTALVIAAAGVVLGGMLMLARTGGAGAGATGGTVDITLPPQAWVVETQSLGDRLVLRVEQPDGTGALYVIEPASGKVIGTVNLKRAP